MVTCSWLASFKKNYIIEITIEFCIEERTDIDSLLYGRIYVDSLLYVCMFISNHYTDGYKYKSYFIVQFLTKKGKLQN